jgi:hypothetical protein
MSLQQDLPKIAVSYSEIEGVPKRELDGVQKTLAPAQESGEQSAVHLQAYFGKEIAPFLKDLNEWKITDRQINLWREKLESIANKPAELRSIIADSKKIDWRAISSPPFTDRVDTFKRDALIRSYVNRLTKFGDLKSEAASLMGQIRVRISDLAAGAKTQTIELTPPPPKGPELVILRDIDPE